MINQFRFDDTEKRFGNGIVPTVAFPAHALNEFVFFQFLPEIVAGILNPTVRMDNQPGNWPPVADSTTKSGENLVSAQRAAQCPPNDHARKQIEENRQI